MFQGYYAFKHEGRDLIGLFTKDPAHQFLMAHLFHVLEKVEDRNDINYVIEDPFLRFIQELFLDRSTSIAVDCNTNLKPVYVVNAVHLVNERIVYRPGMVDIFSITKQRLVPDGDLVQCLETDFPISDMGNELSDVDVPIDIFGRAPSFLDLQYSRYVFRNRLAQHFADALSGGKKRSFRFETICTPSDFHYLASFQDDPCVHKSKKGHISHSMLSLDSIYAMKVPTSEYRLDFFSVSEIFPVVGKYFHVWPLVLSRHYKVGGLKDFEFSAIDRFGMSLTFQYDYFSQRLRVSSRLNIIKYDDAYGADVNSDLLIASISDRLCDGQFFCG